MCDVSSLCILVTVSTDIKSRVWRLELAVFSDGLSSWTSLILSVFLELRDTHNLDHTAPRYKSGTASDIN
jgi:hypothetical protein